jgi:RNA polymerase sigma-70 factor (ECF subfamily)
MESLALATGLGQLPGGLRRLGASGGRKTGIKSRFGVPMASAGDRNDPELWIEAIATRGDRTAFAALFGFYAPRIKGFLMRTGTGAELAEEIVQETMLSVWRKAGMFDASRASVATWIYTVARNLRIDRLRRERGVSAEALYDVLKGDDPSQPDDLLEGDERDRNIRAAMKQLPGEQMAVVQLSFFEDRPHADIARALGIPLGTVKSRLRLAMAKLRESLDDR